MSKGKTSKTGDIKEHLATVDTISCVEAVDLTAN